MWSEFGSSNRSSVAASRWTRSRKLWRSSPTYRHACTFVAAPERLRDAGLLGRARELGEAENGLAVVVTSRADGSAQTSVVNAGVLDHPVTGERIVGFVARGGAKKLWNLRVRPGVTVVFRSGWEWVAVEGGAELVGPEDHLVGLDRNDMPRVRREVYAAAVGGTAEDWAAMDEIMETEGHTAVLIRPVRVYSNPPESPV